MALVNLVSVSQPPKQCQGLVQSHGVGLKSSQIVAGYSHRCYAMIALAHLANIIIVDTSVSSWVAVSPSPL